MKWKITQQFVTKSIKDIATSMEDYVTKYLLFDDVIKYERDIARYKTKQMTFIDIFCNPPKVA